MCSNHINSNCIKQFRVVVVPVLLVAVFVLVCLILAACQQREAIFASLETEEKINTNNLPDELTANGFATMGSTYYVSSGLVMFSRGKDSSYWTKVPSTDNYRRVGQLVQAGNKPDKPVFYLAYKEYEGSISSVALFRLLANQNREFIRELAVKSVCINIAPDGILFGSEKHGDAYAYYIEYDTASPTPLFGSGNGPIMDVDRFLGRYYVLARGQLYVYVKNDGATLDKVTIQSGNTTATGEMRGLLAYDDDDDGQADYLVVSNGRSLWKTDDGKKWDRKEYGSDMFFTDFAYVSQNAFTGLVSGTRYFSFNRGGSKGFREFDKGDINSIKTPPGNKYTSGDLHKADVLGFYIDNNTFFVLTKGSGVWRGTYSNKRDIDWFQE